ncbi:MAG: hypothetical protein KIS95_02245 [Anaerolineae bacterium]|uniref:hypothetical protein n=1 Tax=Promineifilum sp. TaxID=2664178 RepID=UPI001D7663D5|nr:hypothetical protein [Anaerolineales bacterium]MCO5180825.1 hypothetical protein [Promineifilum sp.]MCW5846024.1 hypothetical protein [Anaerolineae bacterium]
MPSRKKIVIDAIIFEPNDPTVVPIDRLFTWVIWQFPRLRENGFNGAVHPPLVGHGWYPAIIDAEGGQVMIYTQIKEPYPNPEGAAKYLDKVKA